MKGNSSHRSFFSASPDKNNFLIYFSSLSRGSVSAADQVLLPTTKGSQNACNPQVYDLCKIMLFKHVQHTPVQNWWQHLGEEPSEKKIKKREKRWPSFHAVAWPRGHRKECLLHWDSSDARSGLGKTEYSLSPWCHLSILHCAWTRAEGKGHLGHF